MNCPICKHTAYFIYQRVNVPVLLNKVYDTEIEASSVKKSNIDLYRCDACDFVFNGLFDPYCVEYDESYENEQAHSPTFQKHLNDVVDVLGDLTGKKVIEIGCGKGTFLELLQSKGTNVTGYDPAYTGNNPSIVKEFFCEGYDNLGADLIILRHVLEHISDPLDFIYIIAQANNFKGQIYIEVPCFEWITDNNAYYDVFYEHCNYFKHESLHKLFGGNYIEGGNLFGGQYIYLIADLSKVNTLFRVPANLEENVVWGAGAKGVTLANLYPEVKYLVDINPAKQNKFIAGTGHKIVSPEEFNKEDTLIFSNAIYKEEIEKQLM